MLRLSYPLKEAHLSRILVSKKRLPLLPGVIVALVMARYHLSLGYCFLTPCRLLFLCSTLDLRLPSLFSLYHLPAQPCPHPWFKYHLHSDGFSPSELFHRSIHSISICTAQSHLRLSMSKKHVFPPKFGFCPCPTTTLKSNSGSTIFSGV